MAEDIFKYERRAAAELESECGRRLVKLQENDVDLQDQASSYTRTGIARPRASGGLTQGGDTHGPAS